MQEQRRRARAASAETGVTLQSEIPFGHPEKMRIERVLRRAFRRAAGGPWTITITATPRSLVPAPAESWSVTISGPGAVIVGTIGPESRDRRQLLARVRALVPRSRRSH
jgi:hypothetical protein